MTLAPPGIKQYWCESIATRIGIFSFAVLHRLRDYDYKFVIGKYN